MILYCVHNKTGAWAVELVATHSTSNYGPVVQNILVDANNDVHLYANKYGWYELWWRSMGMDTVFFQ